MKQLAVILLLGLLLFNWAGYRLLTAYLEHSSNIQLETALDDEMYEASQLIVVKIPITHLSYYVNSKEYERVRGQIEVEGIQYKYVKRRIYNDSLEILCVPDQVSTTFRAMNNNLFKFVHGLQHPGQGKKQGANAVCVDSSSPEYDLIYCFFPMGGDNCAIARKYTDQSFHIPSIYAIAADQPPEALVG